jgi:predicted nucleic acid-binding Zn ribbon protein
VPVYVFRCPVCGWENEQLLKLGDTAPRPCRAEGCEGTATQAFARVAVKYDAFGFNHTDSLVDSPSGRSFRALRNKAEEIADG